MVDVRLDAVRESVERLDPVDDREARSIERFYEEMERLTHPFDEEADLVHLTASGFVVGARGTILHLHRKLSIWVQPGGHIDAGESPAEAALRETVEETGLHVVQPPEGPLLLHLDCHPGPRGHTHLDLRYVLLSGNDDPAPPEGESQEVYWFSFDDAQQQCEPALAPALGRLGETARRHEASWRAIVGETNDWVNL